MGRPEEPTEEHSTPRASAPDVPEGGRAGSFDEPTRADPATLPGTDGLEPTEAETGAEIPATEAETGRESTGVPGLPPTRPIDPGATTERSGGSAVARPAAEAGGFAGTDRFAIVRQIGRGGMGVVFEATDRVLDTRVALKTIQHLDPSAIYRFKKEFRSLADITHPNLVRLYELIAEGDLWLLSMELIDDGVDFRSYLRGREPRAVVDPLAATEPATAAATATATAIEATAAATEADVEGEVSNEAGTARGFVPPDWKRLRAAFRQLARGVKALHDAGKLHRDLKPGNVLVRADGRVVLLDFGLVAELDGGEGPPPGGVGPDEPEGQGGRSYQSTNRQIAGTAAYMSPEQAGGRPLTQASDWYAVGVMLFHALTGRMPIEGGGRQVLGRKQKLDAPAPSELAPAIPRDLDSLCVDLLRRDPEARPSGGEILARLALDADADADPSAEADASPGRDLFLGRDRHLAELGSAFGAMVAGRAVVCHVEGRSGVGKSTLIERFLGELAARHDAVILSGRCYEQESVPYKAVDSLIDALTRELLMRSSRELARLIPPGIGTLARIFPVLGRIREVDEDEARGSGSTDPRELRRQAFGALRELLRRFGEVRPLVLAIDDLQWGDEDSVALLADLLRPPGEPRLLLLLSHRSEYSKVGACLKALESSLDPALPRYRIAVEPLGGAETRALALALLGVSGPEAEAQAERIARDSEGSAFFVQELARHARSGRSPESAGGGGLDEVLWGRIRRLPPEALRLLEAAAVAGKPIPLRLVRDASGVGSVPPLALSELRSGRLLRCSGPGLDDLVEAYHDRVRETVSAHIGADARKGYHGGLAIALEQSGDADPETIAVHYLGADEPGRAGRYYERAADQAARALAFERAEDFYRRAIDLARTDADRAQASEKMIHFLTDLARFDDAYDAGREAVRPYGVKLPARFFPPAFALDFLKVKLRLGRRPIASLLDLPVVQDERLTAAVRLLASLGKSSYQVRPELCIALAAKMANLTLKHGLTADGTIGFLSFGCLFLGGILGDRATGHEFGRLSLALVDKFANERQRSEVAFVVGYFGTSWIRPAEEAEALWKVAYDSGLATGDLFHTGCSCAATTMSLHMRGVPMDRVWAESGRFLDTLRPAQLREPIGAMTVVRQAIRNLRGETSDPATLSDATFDEAAFAREVKGYGSRHFAHYYPIVKMQLHYLWGRYDDAIAAAEESAGYLKDSPGMLHSAEHHAYHALTQAALADRGGPGRASRVRSVRRGHAVLAKHSARCPSNFEHKERLVHAELSRIRGDRAAAASGYDRAIDAARRHGYPHIRALAHERAARFHREAKDPGRAEHHLDEACRAYRAWGATAYADALPARLA